MQSKLGRHADRHACARSYAPSLMPMTVTLEFIASSATAVMTPLMPGAGLPPTTMARTGLRMSISGQAGASGGSCALVWVRNADSRVTVEHRCHRTEPRCGPVCGAVRCCCGVWRAVQTRAEARPTCWAERQLSSDNHVCPPGLPVSHTSRALYPFHTAALQPSPTERGSVHYTLHLPSRAGRRRCCAQRSRCGGMPPRHRCTASSYLPQSSSYRDARACMHCAAAAALSACEEEGSGRCSGTHVRERLLLRGAGTRQAGALREIAALRRCAAAGCRLVRLRCSGG